MEMREKLWYAIFHRKKDKSQCLWVCLDAKSSMKMFWVSNHVEKNGLEFEKCLIWFLVLG
jgi:hypothetical protein